MSLHSLLRVFALGLVLSFGTGCQVLWASITSPSDWASGISTSLSGSIDGSLVSSGSKKPGGGDAAYRDDVRQLAALHAQEGPLDDGFLRDLSGVARRHGISDWQAESGTLPAIGDGMREVGTPEREIEATLASLAR